MAVSKKGNEPTEIEVNPISRGVIKVYLVGETPLIQNTMSLKSVTSLLLPESVDRKTKAGRAASGLKHNPIEEYRNAVYRDLDPKGETRLMFPSPSFKGVLKTAALDMPNTTSAAIGRWTWVLDRQVRIWGVPQLYMAIVRSADIRHTPDVRTRAILPDWCAEVSISFVEPNMNARALYNLLHAGGYICGIGDGRQEKGALNFGQFRLVNEGDAEFQRIKATGGREAQDAALENPALYDAFTETVFTWYTKAVAALRARGKDTSEGVSLAEMAETALDGETAPKRRRGRSPVQPAAESAEEIVIPPDELLGQMRKARGAKAYPNGHGKAVRGR